MFDLEKVLTSPDTNAGPMYYSRKLNTFNLSVFDLATKDGTYYLWDETCGKRESCEIGTCLYKQIAALPSNKKHVILYSDSCQGQNRNQFITTALAHALSRNRNLLSIEQKFLEPGHTYNECDSIHSSVEQNKKHASVYAPQDWANIIRTARKRQKQPYTVVPLDHTDFYDFKKPAK